MESFLRFFGLIKGNWGGPGWSGGVYSADPDPLTVCQVDAVDRVDAIARVHDMVYFLYNCKYVPHEVRMHQMRGVTKATAQFLAHEGYYGMSLLAYASHYTWYDIFRSNFYREYTLDEARCIVHWYSVALEAARVAYFPHSGVSWPTFNVSDALRDIADTDAHST